MPADSRRAPGLGRAFRRFSLPVVATLVSSCAGMRLANLWLDPRHAGGPVSRIMVVALNWDPETRRALEDVIASALAHGGAAVVRAHQWIPAGIPDATLLMEEARNAGCDAVLLTHQVGSDLQSSYVHRYLDTAPPGAASWNGHYDAAFRGMGHVPPGQRYLVRNETDLWSARNECCVTWTAVGEEFEARWVDSMLSEFALTVVPELAARGLIAKP